MFKKIVLFLFIFIAAGCQSNKIDAIQSRSSLIDKYYNIYIVATNSSNIEISAMLKEFSSKMNESNFFTWMDIISNKNSYISQVSTGYISQNYTIKPTDEEVDIVSKFISDSINISMPQYPPLQFGNIISAVAAEYVFKINDYEYDKSQDR